LKCRENLITAMKRAIALKLFLSKIILMLNIQANTKATIPAVRCPQLNNAPNFPLLFMVFKTAPTFRMFDSATS
jgi:hypothetical protein